MAADCIDQYEIVPFADETWGWRKRVGGEVVEQEVGYSCRKDAITEARTQNQDEVLSLVNAAGETVGKTTIRKPDALRVVLLRLDGSLYGELDHGPLSGGTPHRITLTPATESGEATPANG